MNKTLELLKLFEKFGVKPGKIIGAGDRKVVPIKKPILSKPLNRSYILEDVEGGKIGINTVKNEIEDIAPLLFQRQLNDVEINNAISNLNYLDRLLNPTNIVDITTKQPVKGLESLRPSIAEDLKKAGKQLEEAGKQLEETKPDINAVLQDFTQAQKAYQLAQKSGYVRATAREIMREDILSKKLKLPKEVENEILNGLGNPIDAFRKAYGEDALEQLDSLGPVLGQFKTEMDAAKIARKKFNFQPKKIEAPETTTIEEAKKAEQEYGLNPKTAEVVDIPEKSLMDKIKDIFTRKKAEPAEVKNIRSEIDKRKNIDDLIDEYNANQDRMSLTDEEGGTLISYDEFNKLNRRNKEIADALENKGISSKIEEEVKPEGIVIPFKKKITEPEEKAEGGIIRAGFASGGRGKKILDLINEVYKKLKGKKSMETVNPKTGEVTVPDEFVVTAEKPIKEFTDDEMIAYIKKYKEEGPTLEEFTKRVNEETGSNFTPEQLAHAYRVKVAYPHSTPIVDSQGKFIGGGLYNPPLDVSVSDRETLTKSIMQTRKSKELKPAEVAETSETPSKAGEGRFTKQQVLEKIIQSTIEANPTDEYVQTTFPNFIKEIRAKPELANNENVWRTFTQDFPDNKRLVVYGDDTVDFFTKGENLPEGMKQTTDLVNTYGISMEEARRIKQMEPEDQVMEIKKLQILKSRNQNANGGLNYLMGF